MLRLLALLVVTVTLGTAQSANAGPFEDGDAAYNLGDYVTALSVWKPLATQGHAKAQLSLGYVYSLGQGVPQNYVRAHMWYSLSASLLRGVFGKIAIENRNTVAAMMTPAQIAQAQEMASKCLASDFKNCD